jgi:hypothetical protein
MYSRDNLGKLPKMAELSPKAMAVLSAARPPGVYPAFRLSSGASSR